MKIILRSILAVVLICTVMLSSAQVTKLSNNTNLESGIPLGNIGIIISRNDSLWRTDGTPAGTFKYANAVSVDSSLNLGFFGGKILFSGITAAAGSELWVTDGTTAGTQLIKDISAGVGSSSPEDFTLYNNVTFFCATTPADGTELWRTDGTESGTVLVKDINPGPGNAFENGANFFVHNNLLFFVANDGIHGNELWKTDGTSAGTVLVRDINPNAPPSNATGFTPLGSQIIFTATDITNGTELWKTDGTETGTVLVKDIAPGFFGSTPFTFLPFNGKLFFGALTLTEGFELWVTDGTNSGTTMVKDINPGQNSSTPFLITSVIINNKFYFSATTAAQGTELWSSDGTPDGTQPFLDINPGPNSSNPNFLLNLYNATSLEAARTRLLNGRIFFQANNGTQGNELWSTDGTTAGTSLVKNINPGAASSLNNSFNYFYSATSIYFSANDGSTGFELWKSDGTEPLTQRVADINPNTGNSSPQFLMYLNNNVLFTAHDGDNANGARDLYIIGIQESPLPLLLLDFNATSRENAVALKWTTTAEINCSHFEIERSKNGVDFEKTGLRQATNNSAQKSSYQFADAEAFTTGVTKLFYRLKMVDKDGKFTYSHIAVVNITPEMKMFYSYPNPAYDEVMVVVNSPVLKEAALSILDQNGKQYYARKINVNGTSQYNVNVSTLASGLYFIQLATNDGIKSVKFMKK